MPRMPSRLVAILILVLLTAACAPTNRTAPPASTAKTASKTAAAKPAQPKAAPPAPGATSAQAPAPATGKPLAVVMGAPLPATAVGINNAGSPIAAPGGGTTGSPPAASGPGTTGSQPAPSGLGDAGGQPGTAAPAGFGGLAWGVSAKSNPGLAHHSVDGAVTTCIWPQGPKDIAGAPIREAFYEFYQDRFYHVWIEFDGMAAYKTALAGLTRAYGPPTQENLEKYYHSWSLGDVNIYCVFHPAENDGDVSFFYQPIYETMMAAKKAGPAKHAPRSAKP